MHYNNQNSLSIYIESRQGNKTDYYNEYLNDYQEKGHQCIEIQVSTLHIFF